MPSSIHEALIEMFRHRPALAAKLVGDQLGLELPRYREARLRTVCSITITGRSIMMWCWLLYRWPREPTWRA